jgi:recombination protein RecA
MANKKNKDDLNLDNTDEGRSLNECFKEVNKKFGPGTLGFLGVNSRISNIQVISTGSLKIDRLTGVGGIPMGYITEIYGLEGSGKTTIMLTTIAEAQKAGHKCLFIDVEHALNAKYAEQLGVDLNELLFTQPNSAEEAFGIMDHVIRSGTVKLIVVDSVSALMPQAEGEMQFGDNVMAGQARLMSSSLRRIVHLLSLSGCAVVFINQIRQKIGIMFGSNETTTGGLALRFYSSLRIKVSQKGLIKNNGIAIGQEIDCTTKKNKLSPPYKSILTPLYYGKGFNQFEEVFDVAVESEIITRKGAMYTYGEEKLGQGKENCLSMLKSNSELYETIRHSVMNVTISKDIQETSDESDEAKNDDVDE